MNLLKMSLPNELLLDIVEIVPMSTLKTLRSVNKLFKAMTESQQVARAQLKLITPFIYKTESKTISLNKIHWNNHRFIRDDWKITKEF